MIFKRRRMCDLYLISMTTVVAMVTLLYPVTAAPPGCEEHLDVAFVLDGSESIREYDPQDKPNHTWHLLTNFTKQVIQHLAVDTHTQVSVVRYATDAILDFTLDRYRSSISAQDALKRLDHVGGNTNTAAAVHMSRTKVFDSVYGDRDDAANKMILVTDGLSNINQKDTIPEAQKARDHHNIEIFAVGVTKYIDLDELRGIASEPVDKHVFHVSSFESLAEIIEVLVHRVCGLPDPTPTPAPPEVCMDGCQLCTDNTTCLRCFDGKFYDGKQCADCMESCAECRVPNMCDRCVLGWFWDETLLSCQECEVVADVAFVIDASGSIRERNPDDKSYDNYVILKNFVKALISRLDVGPDTTRAAAVRFSSQARMEFPLDRYSSLKGILDAIDDMEYGGGHTNTSGALRIMRNDVFREDRGDRPGVRNVGIVITDGKSNKDQNLTLPEAELSKDANITLFVVGVTDEINELELKGIASKPASSHYFNSTDIRQLDSIVLELIKHVCSPENPKADSLSIVSKRDTSGTYGTDTRDKRSLNFDSHGGEGNSGKSELYHDRANTQVINEVMTSHFRTLSENADLSESNANQPVL